MYVCVFKNYHFASHPPQKQKWVIHVLFTILHQKEREKKKTLCWQNKNFKKDIKREQHLSFPEVGRSVVFNLSFFISDLTPPAPKLAGRFPVLTRKAVEIFWVRVQLSSFWGVCHASNSEGGTAARVFHHYRHTG